MEPIKIKKVARVIPFGFKQLQDSNYLEPVKEEPKKSIVTPVEE